MSKRPSNFRKSDIKRGVQALESAGHKLARVEVQKGKIIFFPCTDEAEPVDDLDKELAEFEGRNGQG
jgi:hypothetical protein